MIMIRISFVFLMLMIQLSGFSQNKFTEGELFFSDGKVKALIMVQREVENFTSIKARIDGSEKVFLPNDISGYRLSNGEIYESKEVKISGLDSWFFLKVHVKGSANLYSVYSSSGGELFFLEVKDEFSELKIDNRLSGIIASKFSDCESIGKSIVGGQRISNLSELQKIVKRYNLCINPENEVYTIEKKIKLDMWIGISLSGLVNNFVKNGDNDFYNDGWIVNDYKTGIAPSVFFEVKLSNFISLQPELFYMRREFANDSLKIPINMSTYETLDLSFQSIQFNFPLKYRIPLNQAELFIKAGFTYDILIDSKVNRETYGFTYTRELSFNDNGQGINFGLGYSRYISSGRLDFQVGFSKVTYMSSFGKFNTNIFGVGTSWAFKVG